MSQSDIKQIINYLYLSLYIVFFWLFLNTDEYIYAHIHRYTHNIHNILISMCVYIVKKIHKDI